VVLGMAPNHLIATLCTFYRTAYVKKLSRSLAKRPDSFFAYAVFSTQEGDKAAE
jgi:hypothetical protein